MRVYQLIIETNERICEKIRFRSSEALDPVTDKEGAVDQLKLYSDRYEEAIKCGMMRVLLTTFEE